MVVQLLYIQNEMDSAISLLAGLVILATLLPLLGWALYHWRSAGNRAREARRNDLAMRQMRRVIEEQSSADQLASSELSGNYDSQVEKLMASRSYHDALRHCVAKLASSELSMERRELYARYIEQLQALLATESRFRRSGRT
jgi:hypothetical protein